MAKKKSKAVIPDRVNNNSVVAEKGPEKPLKVKHRRKSWMFRGDESESDISTVNCTPQARIVLLQNNS